MQIANNTNNMKDFSQTFDKIMAQLIHFINYKRPIKFQNSEPGQKDLNIITLGDVGNGKSTLNSFIVHKYIKMMNQRNPNLNLKYDPSKHQFKSSQNAESVTKTVSMISESGLNIIDTPGTNDPNEKLSDIIITSKVVDFLKEKQIIQKQGISGIIQCVMLNNSQRIEHTSIKAMTRQLLSFTILYQNFDVQKCPRLNVVFTNFSKFARPKQNFGFDDEDEDEGEGQQITIEQLIITYKQFLVQEILKEYVTLDQQFIQQRVNQVFQNSNFYAFNTTKDKQQELQEIQRLVDDNSNCGTFFATNLDICDIGIEEMAYFEPVRLTIGEREQIIQNINDNIDHYIQEVDKAQISFAEISRGQESEKLIEIGNICQELKAQIDHLTNENPHIFLKLKIKEELYNLKINLEKFSKLCFGILRTEIAIHSEQMAIEFDIRQKEYIKKQQALEKEIEKTLLAQQQQEQENIVTRLESEKNRELYEKEISRMNQSNDMSLLLVEMLKENNQQANEQKQQAISVLEKQQERQHEFALEQQRQLNSQNQQYQSQIQSLQRQVADSNQGSSCQIF